MAWNFFSSKKANTPQEPAVPAVNDCLRWLEEGLLINPVRWLSQPDPTLRQLGCYLDQLEEEGYLTALPQDLLLAWDDLYRLLADEAQQSSLPLLGLPPVLALKPLLISEGALTDSDFRVTIRGWQRANGSVISGGLDRTGALVRVDGSTGLLGATEWRLLQAVREFSAEQRDKPGEMTNQLGWARIRKQALACQAGMDGFLKQTIVLRPDQLQVAMRRAPVDGVPLIELTPSFDGQPDQWLSSFDNYQQVQDRYHVVAADGSITHVLLSPEVKSVLEGIKRMPGRRVAGDAALQFVRNPYALLGDDAVDVIDEGEFEAAREQAGIHFHRFKVQPHLDDAGRIAWAELVLEPLSGDAVVEILRIDDAASFAAFVCELQAKLAAGYACGFWQGYELELSDFTEDDLHGLQALLERWQQEALGRLFDEVLDLSQYGERVIGLGVIQKPTSPYIGKQGGENWLPPELLQANGLDAELLAKWDTANRQHYEEFCRRIDLAQLDGQQSVRLPGLEIELAMAPAQRLRDAWAEKFPYGEGGSGLGEKGERAGLQIENNIDTAAASDSRVLPVGDNAEAELPAALREDIRLHPHQLQGVAWLQSLFGQRDRKVGGCLLADDMGLGKTLQLLTFVAWYLENSPQPLPVLIVAPVSLLDNWEREFKRFFHIASMPVLKLYGEALSELKLKRKQIPASLQEKGIRNLLKPGWLGGAKIVLTTYETLRDQEFSLARQRWSVMLCDEAQKIKNPAAMVTQAAKAVPALFRVACTGTPVENSLTDLWCLFDFAQPGLLGALNEFGRTYRRPIENKTDVDNVALEQLRERIAPQLLRRTKDEVADLPEKIEDDVCRRLPISPLQHDLYRSSIAEFNQRGELMGKVGDQREAVLGLLHTLKKICAHPHVVRPEGDLLDASPKMRWLMDKLREIRAQGEKVIVFTELRDIQRDLRLAILDHFPDLKDVSIVNGDTSASSTKGPNRQAIIDAFQQKPGFGVIILSTAAVGFGVNVQAANHVIHFTRPWNPAKEDQATDRAYRIGQTKNVWVYYPTITAQDFETFEYKLDTLLGRKRAVARDMLNGAEDLDLMQLAGEVLAQGGALASSSRSS